MDNEKKMLMCGREFTKKELKEIIQTVELFPNLSRTELAHTICDHLQWYTPAGKYKYKSAYNLLIKLRDQGQVKLPEKKSNNQKGRKRKKVKITQKTSPRPEIIGTVSNYEPIEIKKIKNKKQRNLWNEYIERYHPLGYKYPFGCRLRYFIMGDVDGKKEILGCFIFSAAAWALEERDKWIGWEENHRSKYLKGIINNTRFLIFPWVRVKNLASKALSLVTKRIKNDWKEKYNFQPVLLETFVDEEKYTGSCYQAANWIYLGKTKGRGRQDRYNKYLSSPKLIYVYPLFEDFRAYLKGEYTDWGLCKWKK